LEQVGTPAEIYTQPASEFVAEFMGEVNRIDGRVRAGVVTTPFGDLPAGGRAEDMAVQVLIRPEALKIEGAAQDVAAGPAMGAVPARVLASRLLGRTSWLRLCAGTEPLHCQDGGARSAEHRHWHVRVPGQYLPAAGTELRISLDPRQAFVFPAAVPK
jgi:iron(III) transport system ATP-binding protein